MRLTALLALAFLPALPAAAAHPIALHPIAKAELDLAPRLDARQRLGRLIFHDATLSSPPGQACASCHAASVAFSDPNPREPTPAGANPRLRGPRNAPTLMYAAYSPAFHFDQKEGLYLGGQFRDGRAATLEKQAEGPLLNPLEMANASRHAVVEKVAAAGYAPQFRKLYGERIFERPDAAFRRIVEALAAYQRSRAFALFSSKYDAWLAGKAKLTPAEKRGLDVFEREDKGNCAACHPSRPGKNGAPPLFTDFSYDNLGVPKNPANPFYRMARAHNPAGAAYVDSGLGSVLKKPAEAGKFKVPTLRNVALTGPWMHNGYFTDLTASVDFYNTRDVKPACAAPAGDRDAVRRGCWPAPEVAANVNRDELGKLKLSEREVDDLVAFLNTLTDGWTAAR